MTSTTLPAGLDPAQAWQLLPNLIATLEAHRTTWPPVTTQPGAPWMVCPGCGASGFAERHVAVSTSDLQAAPEQDRPGLVGECVAGVSRVDSLGFYCLSCGQPVTIPAEVCRITYDGTCGLDELPPAVGALLTSVADQVAADDHTLAVSSEQMKASGQFCDQRDHDELHADLNEDHDDMLHQVIGAFRIAARA